MSKVYDKRSHMSPNDDVSQRVHIENALVAVKQTMRYLSERGGNDQEAADLHQILWYWVEEFLKELKEKELRKKA